MRKFPKPTEQEIREGPQAVSFQIANGNARHSCVLQTNLPTKVQAQRYLLANWPTIEKMAREALASGIVEGGQIKLMLSDQPRAPTKTVEAALRPLLIQPGKK